MILFNDIGWGAIVLCALVLISIAVLILLGREREQLHDPGPNHPARRGLRAELGDDTLAMLAGGNRQP